jgi:predicted RND superfamily exporter protein
MRVDDLPHELMRPFKAKDPQDPRVILDVFPKLRTRAGVEVDSALHPLFLGDFVRDLRSVDPEVTGVIVQVYESGDLIWKSYVRAGVISLAIIFVVVWLDFLSLEFALLSLLPVAIGFSVTFGAMQLVGVSINPANIIVLPLMFGIGMDSGVHILHRYKQEPKNRPLGLTSGTGKGITITALTTIVAFATMIPARHRGIASLGFVLTVGLTLTLLACLTVMPAWLELRQRRVERKS